MNLEETIVDNLGKDMAEAIDFDVLAGLLIDTGWTKVELEWYTNNENAIDISDWTDENCSKFIKFQRTYLFKDPKDATMFTLKWL